MKVVEDAAKVTSTEASTEAFTKASTEASTKVFTEASTKASTEVLPRKIPTCATIEVHRFFSEILPYFEHQDLSQKLIWRGILLLPGGKPHGLGYTTRIMQHKMAYFRRVWAKETRH